MTGLRGAVGLCGAVMGNGAVPNARALWKDDADRVLEIDGYGGRPTCHQPAGHTGLHVYRVAVVNPDHPAAPDLSDRYTAVIAAANVFRALVTPETIKAMTDAEVRALMVMDETIGFTRNGKRART